MLPPLDLATIFLTNAVISGVAAVMLGFIRRGNPERSGVGSWAAGRTCLALGSLLLYLGMSPQLLVLSLPGFLLIFGGFIFDYAGFCRFLGQKRRLWLLVGLYILVVMVLLYLVVTRAPRGHILVLSMLAQAGPALMCGLLLLRHGQGAARPSILTAGGLYLAWALICLIRLTALVLADFEMAAIAWMTPPALFLSTVILTCHGLSMVWMIVGRLQEVLVHQAATDPLTGALNRRALQGRLESERARVARDGGGFALATFDLDHFKQLNDTHGHAVGDATLVAIVDLARDMLRPGEAVARLGGEEFCLVLSGSDGIEAGRRVDGLRQALGRLDIYSPVGPVTVAASFGIAIHGHDGDDWPALLKAADGALYRAKSLGRNRVERAAAAV